MTESSPLRVGIAGLGVVGAATLRRMVEQRDVLAVRAGRPIVPVAFSVRDRSRVRDCPTDGLEFFADPLAMAGAEGLDVIVELIGGEDLALDLGRKALEAGRDFVTANKAMLAHSLNELAGLAQAQARDLRFEAAIAGAIPIVGGLTRGFAPVRPRAVSGILNGTCNYILSEMHRTGQDFAPILREAQALGFAEADPGLDIDGLDAAHKIALICALAFDRPVDFAGVHVEGIREIEAEDIAHATGMGYAIRLIAFTRECPEGIEQRVHPCLVPLDSPLASIGGPGNAVLVEGTGFAPCMFTGPGAGGVATAHAVLSDLVEIARTRACGGTPPPCPVRVEALRDLPSLPVGQIRTPSMIRLRIRDRIGVLAAITAIMRDLGISIRSAAQQDAGSEEAVTLVLILHPAGETSQLQALERLGALEFVLAPPRRLRILES